MAEPISNLPKRAYLNVTPLRARHFLQQALDAGFVVGEEYEVDFDKLTHFALEGHGITLGITYDSQRQKAGVTVLNKVGNNKVSDAYIFSMIEKIVASHKD